MRFELLGGLAVWDDGGKPLPVVGPSRRGLLAILMLHAGEVLTADRLIDQLWGERAPPTAAKSLQVHVWRLRKALDDGGGNGPLVTDAGGYVLRVEPGQLDLHVFEGLLAQGRAALSDGRAQAASVALAEALALWHGPALAEFGDQPFAREAAARLEELRLEAIEARIDADLLLGRHRAVIAELESLSAANPLRERPRAQLMLALYRCGRQADALAVYRQTRKLLDQELGLEPGPELSALENAVLAHDPSLELATAIEPKPSVSLGVVAEQPSARADRSATTGEERAQAIAVHDPSLERRSRSTTAQPFKVRRRVRRAGLAIAAGGLLLLAAIVVAAVELTGSSPGLVQVGSNSVAVIDTRSNRLVGAAPVGAAPGAIAFGSGSLWVANVDDQTVSRVDPTTLRTIRVIPVGGEPTGIAASANAIWVTRSSPSGTVFVNRVDPAFDAVGPAVRIDNTVPDGAAAIAAQGNAVWVAPSSGLLTRINPATGRIAQQLDPNTGPTALALGNDALWMTDTNADNVTRRDTTGLLNPIAVGHGPLGIAVGDGSVWVADSLDNSIDRIDPSTQAVMTTIPVGRVPADVAVGDGSVWAANSGDGTVTRIDPGTDKVLAEIRVGGSPQAITVANGRAWVSVDAQTIVPTHPSSGHRTLVIDIPLPIDHMDPALAYNATSWSPLYVTCAKLLNYPDRSGAAGAQLTPEVARSLPARADDGRTYTFTIRKGFRFSPPSNQPVTAQTFKQTIERALNPRMRAPLAHEFGDIVGAAAYMAGRAPHISGVKVHGDALTIQLLRPEAIFVSLIAQPIFCAVPSDTPIDPNGVRVIPSAGPYYVSSFAPRQGAVLVRNPNYRSSRPHRFQRIEIAVNTSTQRAVADVEAGRADYTSVSGSSFATIRTLASTLAARYGPGSPAAATGKRQYFVISGLSLAFIDLNTHRPLFSDVRLRQAVNYAIDRRTLAKLGFGFIPEPYTPTDHYLPPGLPGFRDEHAYPLTPDLAKARSLIKPERRTAILYTCDFPPCDRQAQIITNDLGAIGIQVHVKTFPFNALVRRIAMPGEPFDLATGGWSVDYPDPAAILVSLLNDSTNLPTFDAPKYQRLLADAGRLTGPERYLAFGKLDVELARRAAPLIALGNLAEHDFFSARIGCQVYGVYGVDLGALCVRHTAR